MSNLRAAITKQTGICGTKRGMLQVRCWGLLALVIQLAAVPGWAQNTISTVAGGGSLAGTATAADLAWPAGVAKDSTGNIYIAAGSQHVVFKLSANGGWSVFAGVGRGGFGGDGGPALSANLYTPAGIALDVNGNVYIADRDNQRIRRVDVLTGIITTVAGNGVRGVPTNANGDGGPATSGNLNGPRTLVVDQAGNIFIADSDNNKVRRVDAVTQVITTVAGDGNAVGPPQPPLRRSIGDGGPAISAHLRFPRGITINAAGDLFISDSLHQIVRKVDHTTQIIYIVAGTDRTHGTVGGANGDGGPATSALLSGPRGLSLDSGGNLYIADAGDQAIRMVDTNGNISTVAGNGVSNFAGDGGPATAASLNFPIDVEVDSTGNMIIADLDNLRVRVVDSAQHFITTVAGGGMGGDGGPAAAATLSGPQELTMDGAGNLYISDSVNERIRRVTPGNAPIISTVVGNGIGEGPLGDGGPATSATLNGPQGIGFDSLGNFYVMDSNNNGIDAVIFGLVRKVDAAGIITTFAGQATTTSLCNLNTDPCGDGGPAIQAILNFPYGVAGDAFGNVFISDTYLNRIRRIDGATGIITSVAGDGNTCVDPTLACGDGGLATAANLNLPAGIAFDPAGNLLIADSGDNKIRRVNADGTGHISAQSTISTAAYSGAAAFAGNGGSALSASYAGPWSIAVDGGSNIFVAGLSANTGSFVERVDAASGTVATVVGDYTNTAGGFSGDGGPATQASLLIYGGLAVDKSGGLYIADGGNNRVRYVHLTPVAAIAGAIVDFGQQADGTTSLPQSITLANTGGASLLIGGISASADYLVSSTCTTGELGPLGSCTISVSFLPTIIGVDPGTLTINTNDPLNPVQVFALTGTGYQPFGAAGFSAPSLTFATQNVGTMSAPQSLTLSNAGTAPLALSNIAITGINASDFAQTNNCPASLAPGGNCILLVSYMPVAAGASTAAVTVTDNQGNVAGSQQMVTLTGTGFEPPPASGIAYGYIGNAFQIFGTGTVCLPNCSVTGSFTLGQPLAANLTGATIVPQAFSFQVGTTVINQTNAAGATFTNISTNASGAITGWTIQLTGPGGASTIATTSTTCCGVVDTFATTSPALSASNTNATGSWGGSSTTPVTFVPGQNVTQTAVFFCPAGTNPCPTPSGHSIQITLPMVNTPFTMSVTATQIPGGLANGTCPKGQTEVTNPNCRFTSVFASQVLTNGDTVVPLCNTTAGGSCVVYHVGNVPAGGAFSGTAGLTINWSAQGATPPNTYQGSNPRLYKDPAAAPYNLNHQFVLDVTGYSATMATPAGIGGTITGESQGFSDFMVAFPPTATQAYQFSWAGPLSGSRTARFEQGDRINVRFKLSPDPAGGIAVQSPNHVGYAVLLDTNQTGCADLSGTPQPTQVPTGASSDFTYDPVKGIYVLQLSGIYKPGLYKLVASSNLLAQQCAAFKVTPDH
jgi:hypothetical protein